MSGVRWVDPAEVRPTDMQRRAWCEEYLSHPELARMGVTWGEYARLREAGRWNEFAERKLSGRFKVEGE